MKSSIEAIYENGAFRPLQPEEVAVPNGQVVQITIENKSESEQILLAAHVYKGLSEREIDDIEHIALDRRNFIGTRSDK